MMMSEALLPEFDVEMANTRRTLERVPVNPDFAPHSKSTFVRRADENVAALFILKPRNCRAVFEEYTKAGLGCAECLLGTPAIGDIQVKSGKPCDLALGITVRAAESLDPRHRPIGPHDAKCVVPAVPCLRVQNIGKQTEHLLAVLLMETG